LPDESEITPLVQVYEWAGVWVRVGYVSPSEASWLPAPEVTSPDAPAIVAVIVNVPVPVVPLQFAVKE
jgi:hypothetical protein